MVQQTHNLKLPTEVNKNDFLQGQGEGKIAETYTAAAHILKGSFDIEAIKKDYQPEVIEAMELLKNKDAQNSPALKALFFGSLPSEQLNEFIYELFTK